MSVMNVSPVRSELPGFLQGTETELHSDCQLMFSGTPASTGQC